VNGIRVTVMPTASSRADRSPDQRESAIVLELAEQVLDRFRPDVLLSYGGHPASPELMRWARSNRIEPRTTVDPIGPTPSAPRASGSRRRSERAICEPLDSSKA